jgi:hypothetical protein
MAITRTQIARQLYRVGGVGGRAEEGPVERGGMSNRDRGREESMKEAQRKADLRNITNRIRDDKIEEDLEKFRDLGSTKRKVESFASKFSPIAMFASKFGPLNTKDFFLENYLSSKNAPMTKEQFSLLSPEEQQEEYDEYMADRMSGKTDAYGNEITRGDRGDPNILFPQGIMTQAPSITEQEPEPEENEGLRLAFRADGGPIGGEYDFESARQMYGLGKLVKKVTRTVKKIAKSPIGKAALTAATIKFGGPLAAKVFPSTFGSAASSPFLRAIGRGQFFGDTGIFSAGKAALFGSNAVGPNVPEGILSKIGPLGAIAGVSALAGLLTAQQEEEAQELSRGEGIDIEAARRMILQAGTSADKRGLAFRAEGGRIGYQEGSKEPVAKKTMPLLDMGGKEMDLREDGGFVPIGRMEKADDVPARLSKNEFVFTADAVRNAGDGDVDKGAEVMYNMMKNLEAGGDVSKESQGLEGARKMFQTSQRLEEVL